MDSRFSWSTDYHHPTTWDQEFPPLSLPDMLAASVARKGDVPMLDFMGRQFGYAEVARGVARVARGLQQLGLGKGSRVGLFLPNVRSDEHTSELQSLMRISYAVFCLKKK